MRAVMLNTPQQSEFLLLLSPQFFKFCLLASNSRDAKLATPKKFKREKNFEGIWVTRSSQENERATMTPSRKNSARSPISAPKRDVGRVSCEASKTMPFAKHDAWFNEHLPTASLRTTRPGGRGPEAESSIWKKKSYTDHRGTSNYLHTSFAMATKNVVNAMQIFLQNALFLVSLKTINLFVLCIRC